MSENQVAVSRSKVPAKFSDFTSELQMKDWAETMLDSGLMPKSVDTPEAVILIVTMGNELGLSPIISLNNIDIISNRPTLKAAMMGSLLYRAGIEFELIEDCVPVKKNKEGRVIDWRTTYKYTNLSKIIKGKVIEQKYSFYWSYAVKAGYTEKDNWTKHKTPMMRARCMSYAVRGLFPYVIDGIYSDLEMNDNCDNPRNVIINDAGEATIDTDAEVID